jgi:hypothetical protein
MADVFVYKNVKAPEFEGISDDLHKRYELEFAYETPTHFVHIFGGAKSRLGYVWHHRAIVQEKKGVLIGDHHFGGQIIGKCLLPAGEVTTGVWRPGLHDPKQSREALAFSEDDELESEHALRLLIARLDEVVNFVEPRRATLNVFSHKLRELLILSCTEVENRFIQYLQLAAMPKPRNGFTTNQYVKLKSPLYLADYSVTFRPYTDIEEFRPFADWRTENPTTSIEWYDSYNKTKHDRKTYFEKSTLQNCLSAVAASVILHCVRFRPYGLFDEPTHLSSLINQYCEVRLMPKDPRTFYVGYIDLSKAPMQGLSSVPDNLFLVKWTSRALRL